MRRTRLRHEALSECVLCVMASARSRFRSFRGQNPLATFLSGVFHSAPPRFVDVDQDAGVGGRSRLICDRARRSAVAMGSAQSFIPQLPSIVRSLDAAKRRFA